MNTHTSTTTTSPPSSYPPPPNSFPPGTPTGLGLELGPDLELGLIPAPWTPNSPCRLPSGPLAPEVTDDTAVSAGDAAVPAVITTTASNRLHHSPLMRVSAVIAPPRMPMMPMPMPMPMMPPMQMHTAPKRILPAASVSAGMRTPPRGNHHSSGTGLPPAPPKMKKKRQSERNYSYFHVRINVPIPDTETTTTTSTLSTLSTSSTSTPPSSDDAALVTAPAALVTAPAAPVLTSTAQDTAFVERVLHFLNTNVSPTFMEYTVQLEECPTTQRRHLQMVVKVHPKTTRAKMVSDWYYAFPHLQQHLHNEDNQKVTVGDDEVVPANARRADGAEWYCEPQICTRGGAAANRYCMKQETRVDGPWTKGGGDPQQRKRKRYGAAATGAAAAMGGTGTAVHPIHTLTYPDGPLYTDNTELRLLEPHQFYMWQRELLRKLARVPDDRTIFYLHEPNGNTGKSVFSKYLCCTQTFPDGLHSQGDIQDARDARDAQRAKASSSGTAPRPIYLSQLRAIMGGGRAQDMKYAIVQYHKTHGYFPNVVIFDISRTQMDKGIDYQGIEEIKNGCFLATKYESTMVGMNPPHVVVLANEEADRSRLSADRWDVTYIQPDPEHDTEMQM